MSDQNNIALEELLEAADIVNTALFLLLKRLTKLGEHIGEPDSAVQLGWDALDEYGKALKKWREK